MSYSFSYQQHCTGLYEVSIILDEQTVGSSLKNE